MRFLMVFLSRKENKPEKRVNSVLSVRICNPVDRRRGDGSMPRVHQMVALSDLVPMFQVDWIWG